MAPRTSETIVYNCNYCEKEYSLKTSLQSHLRVKHNMKLVENAKKTEAILASCNIMNEVVENAMDSEGEEFLSNTNTELAEMLEIAEADLLQHVVEEEPITIDEVDNDHNKNETQNPNSCNICDESLADMNSLNDHIREKHSDNQQENSPETNNDECRNCDNMKEVEEFMNIVINKKQETIEKNGSSLNKMAKEKRSLIGEIKSLKNTIKDAKKETTNKKIFVCDVCNEEAISKEKLKTHIHCVECSKSFKKMTDLNSHIQQIHAKWYNRRR